MQGNPRAGSICGNCAYWRHSADHLGFCRRHAPELGDQRDEVAHWPNTVREDYCGEWRENVDDTPKFTFCRNCVYWSSHEGGISPMELRDQLPEWWSRAGRCLRFAPRPSGLPGHKVYRRATNGNDGCFDGKSASP